MNTSADVFVTNAAVHGCKVRARWWRLASFSTQSGLSTLETVHQTCHETDFCKKKLSFSTTCPHSGVSIVLNLSGICRTFFAINVGLENFLFWLFVSLHITPGFTL